MSNSKTNPAEPLVIYGKSAICRALNISPSTFDRLIAQDEVLSRICRKGPRGRRIAVVDDLKAWAREQGERRES